ncbi:hypothetical protein WR25_00545 isoform A [Diploscapter pachys]|uniref:F-box domain-containing protein n=1 Tax=Diploscapter pachys TaxID=2018661 RepID=A0A2A2JK20_9BILA|nr:hypothetical protein WR25_00545 isoform A [Diploscapter pachys]
MLSGLPTELIIMSCQYLSFRDVDELAYTTKRMMQIVKRNVPLALQPRIEMKNMAIYPSLTKKSNIRFVVEWKKMAELRKSSRNTDDHIEIILKPKIDDGDLKIYEAFLDYYRYRCVERDYVKGRHLNWERFAVQRAGLVGREELVPPINFYLFLARAEIHRIDVRIEDDIDWHLTESLSTVRATFVEKKLYFGSGLNAKVLDAADQKRIQETKFIQNDIVEVECKATAQFLSTLFQMRHFSNARWELYDFEQEHFQSLIRSSARSVTVKCGNMHLIAFISDLVREPPFKPRRWTLWNVKIEEKRMNWKGIEAILKNSTDVSSWHEQPVCGWQKRYKIRSNKQTWNLDIRPTQMKMWVSIFAPPPSGTYIDIKIS